ncbi:MAG TPA: sialidase family protein [Polyangia bacterium]|nr:sialidase family protein [Polyangia bacterium]
MVGRGSKGAGTLAAAVTALLLMPRAARANGAFPNGQSILAPADRPGEIVLATNFGLVATEDDGHTWTYSCEQAITSFGRLYQMGPAPTHRLFAIAQAQLVYSDDDACGWATAGGALGGNTLCEDAFVDPSDGTRVLAAALAGGAGILYTVYESTDGGATFDRALYTAAPGDLVTGIEIAASDPMTVDVALSHGPEDAPTLARSTDGGVTWALTDLTGAVGTGQVRILAIDPTDADRVFLRVLTAAGDTLAIVTNGGATVTTPLSFGGGMGAFVRTSAGTLLAFGSDGGSSALYRSTDGGASFAPLPGPPPILALAERAGVIYAATDSTLGPYAEATSADEGASWTPGLAFSQVAAIQPCVKGACQSDCLMRAQQQQWPAAICSADAPVSDPPGATVVVTDGGVASDAGTVVLLHDASIPAVVDASDVPRTAYGCRCATTDARAGSGWAVLLLLAALARGRRRR